MITREEKNALIAKINEVTPEFENHHFDYYENGYNDGSIAMAEKIKNLIEEF